MKRATRKHKLMVGGFVVLMTMLAAAAVLTFSDDFTLFKSRSRYFALFKDTGGLHVGAPLKMGGVDIGSVHAIHISTTGATPEVLLSLVIYAPYNALIKADSEASLETQGMLGDNFLNVTTGSAGAEPIEAESFIKTKERTGMSTIVTESTDILKTVGQTTGKLEKFVDTLPDAAVMKGIASDFRTSSSELAALIATLNAENSALRLLADKGTAMRVEATIASLQSTSRYLESVAKKIDSGQGTLGALVNDPALYDDMRKLLGRANRSKAAKFIIEQVLDRPDETPPAIK